MSSIDVYDEVRPHDDAGLERVVHQLGVISRLPGLDGLRALIVSLYNLPEGTVAGGFKALIAGNNKDIPEGFGNVRDTFDNTEGLKRAFLRVIGRTNPPKLYICFRPVPADGITPEQAVQISASAPAEDSASEGLDLTDANMTDVPVVSRPQNNVELVEIDNEGQVTSGGTVMFEENIADKYNTLSPAPRDRPADAADAPIDVETADTHPSADLVPVDSLREVQRAIWRQLTESPPDSDSDDGRPLILRRGV